MQYFYDVLSLPKVALRQGALHWLGAYDLAKCRGGDGGYVMITPTPTPDLLFEWMVETGFDDVARWVGADPVDVLLDVTEVMDAVRRWIAPRDASEVWWSAQERHVAFGGVLSIAEVCANPQFAHRNFFAEVSTPERIAANGSHVSANAATGGAGNVSMPGRLVRWSDVGRSGSIPPSPPAALDTPLDEILASWAAPASEARNGASRSPVSAASSESADERRPLDGIRIADFTWVLAGPSATKLLGDLGADVIRIQSEERSTLVNSPDFPCYFVWNRSKRSATLDMKHPDALAAARRLIETCDVLIENFSAGVLDSWGLDWETVHEWNPRFVYVTMSGCGHDGSWRHVISYAPTVHAVCGITHLTNFADRGDVGPGFSLNDHLAGFAAAVSTVGALYARERTGKGQRIDMAQLEVGTYAIGAAIIRQSAGMWPLRPEGNRDGIADHVPNEVYACSDGFVAVTVTETAQWLGLSGLLADPRLDDPTLATESGRRDRRSMIDAVLGEWAAGRTAVETADALQAAGVPAGPVQNSQQLFADDPQHEARGFWQPVDHAVFGERTVDAFAGLWNGQRWFPRHLSPAYLGEHNFDVWTDVGYDFDEVADGIGTGLFN